MRKLVIASLIAIVGAFSAPIAPAQDIDSTIHVKAFPGTTVGEKVSNAARTCSASGPCILVIDPSLSAYPDGAIPGMCPSQADVGCIPSLGGRAAVDLPWGVVLRDFRPGKPGFTNGLHVNPANYGAVLNGTTDDHAALQAAIAANRNAIIEVPPNSAGLNLGTVGVILTDGQTFDGQNVPIKYSGSGIAITNAPGTVANGVTIKRVRLNMTGSTGAAQGIILQDCEYCKIENATVSDGPANFVGLGMVTTPGNCCTISSKIERSRTNGRVLMKGADDAHQVTDSTIDTVYCGALSEAYCYETNYVLNPVFINAIAESFTSAAFYIHNTWGAVVIKGSDVEGSGPNVFNFGAGNSSMAIDASVSLSGWSGTPGNFVTVTGVAPIQGRILSNSSQIGTLTYGTENNLSVTNTVGYGAVAPGFVEVGATNTSAVNGANVYKYRWMIDPASGAGGQLLNLVAYLSNATTLTPMQVLGTGVVNFPLGMAITLNSGTGFAYTYAGAGTNHTWANIYTNGCAGHQVQSFLGYNATAYNMGDVGFYCGSSGSTSNFTYLGTNGNVSSFRFYGDNHMTINGVQIVDTAGNIGNGANTVYRCATAGTLPAGALTITSASCGTTTDTGLRAK